MIHYNVWFTFKEGIDEREGLGIIDDFLTELRVLGEVATFRLLRNNSDGSRTKLPKFHAIIEFQDDEALSRAMKNQETRGVHQGKHGEILEVVSEFRVEIFRLVVPEPVGSVMYACEI
jgi:hypothetical protein